MHGLELEDISRHISNAIEDNLENDRIEFKKGANGLGQSIYNSISSFSNTPGGGLIVWGVEEIKNGGKSKFQFANAINAQELQEGIYKYITSRMRSVGEHTVRTVAIDGHTLVVLAISELRLESKPCYEVNKGINKGTYIRVGNVDRQATEDEVRSFLKYSPEYKYDQLPVADFSMTDLDEVKIRAYLDASAKRTGRSVDSAGATEPVLINKKLLIQHDGGVTPSLAGVLLFSKSDPQSYGDLSRYVIRCVRYEDTTSASAILDSLDVEGTLDNQVDQSYNFVLRNIAKSAKIEGSKRVETYEYPELALREAIVNAVIHRDYSIKETYVQISVFSDRIEISNPGVLPPGITIDNLKESQFSRNTIIAGVMRDFKYMEEFGRGIDLIYNLAGQWGLPKPLFKNKANTFKTTLLGDRFNELNERQIHLWNTIQERTSLTSRAARDAFPDISKATISNDIKGLVDRDLITQKGSGVNTFYEANY